MISNCILLLECAISQLGILEQVLDELVKGFKSFLSMCKRILHGDSCLIRNKGEKKLWLIFIKRLILIRMILRRISDLLIVYKEQKILEGH